MEINKKFRKSLHTCLAEINAESEKNDIWNFDNICDKNFDLAVTCYDFFLCTQWVKFAITYLIIT